MTYHTLIFDLDGTLTDPVLGIMRCMNHALKSFNYAPRPQHEITPHIGPPLEIALQALSGSEDESRIKQLVATYRERYGEIGFSENSVYDGVYEMLNELQQLGFRMGICTSKLEKYAVRVLQEFDLLNYFEFVSGGDYGISKADQLAELLSTKTVQANSLMIGDRSIDLSSARANGLHCAAVLWGYGSEQELGDEVPTFVFSSPQQLLEEIIRL